MNSNKSSRIRIVFTQGGKGGVAKTEATLSLVSWYQQQGIQPYLLDFDVENVTKSGLQNFHPETLKFDVHERGALDEFLVICDRDDMEVVLADQGAGAGKETHRWFNRVYEDVKDLEVAFTSIGVTTNDAGAVQSVLNWAEELQDRVDYLVVLNEMRERDSAFDYWFGEPTVEQFTRTFRPHIMRMDSRIEEFQSELRNQVATLHQVIAREANCDFLRKTKNVLRAKRYQRHLFAGFDEAAAILLPSHRPLPKEPTPIS